MSNIKIDYTGWGFHLDMIKKYAKNDDDYYLYEYKCNYAYTDEIVGLSYRGVLRQEKLDRLYDSIKEHGYYYDRYQDLHLVYLPDKTYTVSSGGNHRPYLAKMMGIKKVMAYIEILIPKNILTDQEIKRCEEIIEEEGFDLNYSNPYFYGLCEKYDLLPPKLKVRVNYT